MAKSRFLLAIAVLLSGCGIKHYTNFVMPGSTGEVSSIVFFDDHRFRASLSAVCDPANGANTFFVTFTPSEFTGASTAPVTLRDVQVTETITYGTQSRTHLSTDFTVSAAMRTDDSGPDHKADASTVAALPEEFRVIPPPWSVSAVNLFQFRGTFRADHVSSPSAVSLVVTFDIAEGASQRRETRTVQLTKKSHSYFWFLRGGG